MLANIGELTKKPKSELLVAVSSDGKIVGGVVYFSDMKYSTALEPKPKNIVKSTHLYRDFPLDVSKTA